MPERDNLLDHGEREKSPSVDALKRTMDLTAHKSDNDLLEEWIFSQEKTRKKSDEK